MDTAPNAALEPPVLFTLIDGVARITLNRPAQLNTIDVAMAEAFEAACRRIAATPTTRVVVLNGAGRGFGGGGDLTTFRSEATTAAPTIIGPMHEGLKLLTAIDAPVIASLHGVVAGGSLSLALACDLAIAAEGTRFNLAYVNIGSSCDVSGSYSLPRLVGLRNALGIALLGETFDAAEACRLGLVNKVVPADRLVDETDLWVRRFATGPTLAVGRLKRLMRSSFEHDLASQLDRERDAFVEGTKTRDFAEGLTAFFERRPPVFGGH
jgi:2-(1,2-epoxy-1,2-dihydrophenyl)acetyl-CoA isomerase